MTVMGIGPKFGMISCLGSSARACARFEADLGFRPDFVGQSPDAVPCLQLHRDSIVSRMQSGDAGAKPGAAADVVCSADLKSADAGGYFLPAVC